MSLHLVPVNGNKRPKQPKYIRRMLQKSQPYPVSKRSDDSDGDDGEGEEGRSSSSRSGSSRSGSDSRKSNDSSSGVLQPYEGAVVNTLAPGSSTALRPAVPYSRGSTPSDIMQLNRGISSTLMQRENARRFFCGYYQFELQTNRDASAKLYDYIYQVYYEFYGYLKGNQVALKNSDMHHLCLAQFICTILRLNGVPFMSHRVRVLLNHNYVCGPEPALIRFNRYGYHELELVMALPVIEHMVNNVDLKLQRPHIAYDSTFRVGSIKSDDLFHSMDTFDRSAEFTPGVLDTQELTYKLFVIADHACTHFLEEFYYNRTDYVNHEMFGTTPVRTLHSMVKMTAVPDRLNLSIGSSVMAGGGGAASSYQNLHTTFQELTAFNNQLSSMSPPFSR